MSDDYRPFPEADLESLAKYHDDAAKAWPERTYARGLHEERASVCREAIRNFRALRDRCLTAELVNRNPELAV